MAAPLTSIIERTGTSRLIDSRTATNRPTVEGALSAPKRKVIWSLGVN